MKRSFWPALLLLAPQVMVETPVQPTYPIRGVDRVLLQLPMQGDTITVIGTFFLWPDDRRESAEIVRIRDRRAVQFTDSLRPRVTSEQPFDGQIDVSAHTIEWPERTPGMRIDCFRSPDWPPPWRGPCRYFMQRGSRIVPVSPWCDACEGLDSTGIVRFRVEVDDYFDVLLPARVRIDQPGGGLEFVARHDAADRSLLALKTDLDSTYRIYPESPGEGKRLPDESGRYRLKLYRSVSGNIFDVIAVAPSTPVTFGDLWARVESEEEREHLTVRARIVRLGVTIDGRRGFVEETDFFALGLNQF